MRNYLYKGYSERIYMLFKFYQTAIIKNKLLSNLRLKRYKGVRQKAMFDHFHVVKLMNEKLDDIRRKVYSMEKDINKCKVLKGTRYLLFGNGADIINKQHKTRLENALAMNEPLLKAYYLKEQLHQIWSQPMKAMAENVLDDWIRQAEQSKITQLQKMAVTVKTYKKGILAWYDCHLSTRKVEGINNKIKVMKRNAYGFRDEKIVYKHRLV